MKKLLSIALIAMAAVWMSGCEAPAGNANSSNAASNANANKAAAAAPTADTLLAMDRQAHEAYARGDGAFFEGMLSDKFVMTDGKERMGKAAIVNRIKSVKCELKDGIKLSEPQMAKIDNDTYALAYKDDTAGSCTEGGETVQMKPSRAATVWVRNGEKWQAVWHGSNDIMSAPASETKPADAKPQTNTAANSNSAANNAAAPATADKLTPSPNTEALAKIHAAGWEAFRAKDAKFFETNLTDNFMFIDPAGGVHTGRAATIQQWTVNMKCEGITKTSFTDAFAQSISPTVELLFGKGNADGKCDGMPNGDLWQTSAYVKQGDAWKIAFMFESLK